MRPESGGKSAIFETLLVGELRRHLFSMKFSLAVTLLGTAILLSTMTLVRGHKDSILEYRSLLAENESRRAAAASPLERIYNTTVFRPPAPGSILCESSSSASLQTADISALAEPVLSEVGVTRSSAALFGRLDFVTIVRTLVSLLAIVFLYDSVCGEKQTGTLRLVLSNPVPRDEIVLSKILGGFLCVSAALLLTALASFVVLAASGILFEGDFLMRVVLVLLSAFLYTAVFVNLSVLVSTLTSDPARSLVTLLFIWMVLVIAVPRISPQIGAVAVHAPSPASIREERQAARREIRRDMLSFVNVSNRVPSDGAAAGEAQAEIIRRSNEADRRVLASVEPRLFRREQVARTFARISPASSFTFLAASMAGTGPVAEGAFLAEARGYQRRFAEYAETNVPVLMERIVRQEKNPPLDDPPEFQAPAWRLSSSLREGWLDVLLLGIETTVLLSLAHFAFLRYDPR